MYIHRCVDIYLSLSMSIYLYRNRTLCTYIYIIQTYFAHLLAQLLREQVVGPRRTPGACARTRILLRLSRKVGVATCVAGRAE